ncbi:MAG: hypothetical protein ACJ8AG_02155, partial [Ktedonobacteraceae bacterium]
LAGALAFLSALMEPSCGVQTGHFDNFGALALLSALMEPSPCQCPGPPLRAYRAILHLPR